MYKKMLVLRFPAEVTDQPLICSMTLEFNLCFNILKAEIFPGQDGLMILELWGLKKDVVEGLKYLRKQGVEVKTVDQEISRNFDICIQCGACTGICPTNALYMNKETMEVMFDPKKCTACELCVLICPVKAMEISFSREKLLSR